MDKLKKIASKYNLDISEHDPIQLIKGMRVEKEHDTDDSLDVVKNVGDLMKIAMAHLNEFPDYYEKLEKMEESKDSGVEAYGVMGLKSKKFKKKFKNQKEFEKWLEKNEGNVEVYGSRDLDEIKGTRLIVRRELVSMMKRDKNG
jgi:hypothetical protein